MGNILYDTFKDEENFGPDWTCYPILGSLGILLSEWGEILVAQNSILQSIWYDIICILVWKWFKQNIVLSICTNKKVKSSSNTFINSMSFYITLKWKGKKRLMQWWIIHVGLFTSIYISCLANVNLHKILIHNSIQFKFHLKYIER